MVLPGGPQGAVSRCWQCLRLAAGACAPGCTAGLGSPVPGESEQGTALFLLGVTQVEELIKTTRVCVGGRSQIRTELECSSLELGLCVPSACHRAVAMARCWLVVLAVSPLLAALSTEGGEGEAFRGLGRSALGLESCPAGSFAASPGNVELLGSSSALLPGHALPSCCWG